MFKCKICGEQITATDQIRFQMHPEYRLQESGQSDEIRSKLKFALFDKLVSLMVTAEVSRTPESERDITRIRTMIAEPTRAAVQYFINKMSKELVGYPKSFPERELPGTFIYHEWLPFQAGQPLEISLINLLLSYLSMSWNWAQQRRLSAG